ncbi:MAG: hypothetical protein ACPGVZ_06310 [Myxococcota bacterium]
MASASYDRPRTPRLRGASLPALLLLGVLVACSAPGPGQSTRVPDAPEMTPSGLALARKTPRSMLWVRPDHHVGHYDEILITGVGFTYGLGQTELDPTQEAKVRAMLIEAMNAFTEDPSPVGRAFAPGPCVVAIQLGLKDMRLHVNDSGASGSSISYVNSFGSATMIIEFRDSRTDEVLIRYASHRGLGGGPGTGRVGANLPRLGRALGDMVTDMTLELQKITPSTTVRTETECNDGIYKLTGREPA